MADPKLIGKEEKFEDEWKKKWEGVAERLDLTEGEKEVLKKFLTQINDLKLTKEKVEKIFGLKNKEKGEKVLISSLILVLSPAEAYTLDEIFNKVGYSFNFKEVKENPDRSKFDLVREWNNKYKNKPDGVVNFVKWANTEGIQLMLQLEGTLSTEEIQPSTDNHLVPKQATPFDQNQNIKSNSRLNVEDRVIFSTVVAQQQQDKSLEQSTQVHPEEKKQEVPENARAAIAELKKQIFTSGTKLNEFINKLNQEWSTVEISFKSRVKKEIVNELFQSIATGYGYEMKLQVMPPSSGSKLYSYTITFTKPTQEQPGSKNVNPQVDQTKTEVTNKTSTFSYDKPVKIGETNFNKDRKIELLVNGKEVEYNARLEDIVKSLGKSKQAALIEEINRITGKKYKYVEGYPIKIKENIFKVKIEEVSESVPVQKKEDTRKEEANQSAKTMDERKENLAKAIE